MSIFDSLLGQLSENVDIKNLAEKVGLEPGVVEQAIQALGAAHPQPGDTISTASEQTGLSPDVLQNIVSHLGGEGALGKFASLLQDEGLMNKAGGLLSGFLGSKS